jgi:NitT/TauT family transport system substrate-binding protein
MKLGSLFAGLLAAVLATVGSPLEAQTTKFPFRLNWVAGGEHLPFFVAREKGFYRDEGLDVDILDGSGSGTVLQLIANGQSPVGYADAATMMRGVSNGMPVRAIGVPLQLSPHAFIYRADAPRPTKISEVKGSRIAMTAGDASLAMLTAFLGKVGLKLDDVQIITVATPAAKDQAMLNRQADAVMGFFIDQGVRLEPTTGVKVGYTKLYDMAGVSTLSGTIIANTDWLKDAKNQDLARRFLRASQRGWQYSAENRQEAADLFVRAKPNIARNIALGTFEGALTLTRTERTKGKPFAWSAPEDWKDSQDLLAQYAGLKPQSDLNVYFTNGYLSEAPYTR